MTLNADAPDPGDALELISLLAGEVGHALAADYMQFKLHKSGSRHEMLDTAFTLLIQNVWHVPVAVDEIIERTLSQGGYTPRIP